jgi:hypothetical protein
MKSSVSGIALRCGVLTVVLGMLLGAAVYAQTVSPSLGVAMRVEDIARNEEGSYTVIYEIVVRNYGDAPLADLSVVDDLSAAFADAVDYRVVFVESETSLANENYDGVEDVALLAAGSDLAPGGEETITLEVNVDPGDLRGPFENSAVATAVGPGGERVHDMSQAGPNPDPDGNGDPQDNSQPTPVVLADAPIIGLSKDLTSKTDNGDGSYTLVYEFVVRNYGNVSLAEIQVEEDLSITYATPAVCEITSVTSSDLHINDAFDGTDDTDLLTWEDTLDVGETARATLTVCLFRESGVNTYSNSAIASGRSPTGALAVDSSQRGADPDPDGDGDPRNNNRSTIVSFAEFETGGTLESSISVSKADGTAIDVIALNTFLTIEGFTAQLQTAFRDVGMDTFSVAANGTLGKIRLNSSLIFDPSTVSFVSLQGGAAFTLLDLEVTNIVYLGVPQTTSYTQFAVSGTSEGFSAQGTVRFGTCPLEFWALNGCGTWKWPQCDTAINGCVLLTGANGFTSATLSVSNLVLLEDVFGMQGILDATLSFTVDEKVFSPRFRFEPDWLVCANIELLGEIFVSSSPIEVNAMLIYGLVGECTLSNGVKFTFAESLSEEKNSSVTGKAEYWEVLRVSGPLPSCCDDAGSFEIGTYFGGTPPPPSSLFGVGLFTASFDLRLFNGFGVTFDASYPTDGTPWAFSVTFRVFW